MGTFYGNVTLLDVSLEDASPIVPRPALVAQVGDDAVVFAAVDDPMPTSGLALSDALGCTAVSAAVHDDDLLWLEVVHAGALVLSGGLPDPAEVFGPEVHDDDGDGPPASGLGVEDAVALVTAVGRGGEAAVAAVLGRDHLFASDAHRALARALGLPDVVVPWGYRYLVEDPGSFGGPPLEALR